MRCKAMAWIATETLAYNRTLIYGMHTPSHLRFNFITQCFIEVQIDNVDFSQFFKPLGNYFFQGKGGLSNSISEWEISGVK